MSQVNDFFTALRMLEQGVNRYATTRAINSANEEVQKLQDALIDDTERVKGLRSIADGLTQRLAGLGADNTTIAQVTESIRPDKGPVIQSPFQGIMADLDTAIPSDREEVVARSQKYIEDQNTVKQVLKADKDRTKAAKDSQSRYDTFLDRFGKIPGNKELISALATSEVTPDDLTNPAAFVAAQRGYIKASGDNRISNEDLKGAKVDRSLWGAVVSAFTRGVTGAEPEQKAAIMQALLDVSKYKSAKAIKKRVGAYSREASQFDRTEDEVALSLMNRYLGGAENVAAEAPASRTQGAGVIPAAPVANPAFIPYNKKK